MSASASIRTGEHAARLTLTRRGRFVLVGLPLLTGAAALVVLAVVFLVPSTASAGSDPHVGADPQRDPRDVMDEIVELNDLRSSALVAGQELVVPAA